ncbi:MAG: SDR family oxidoreductase, partial [Alphaproteobacteria bacterium]|nr:SDR family oxidoreductase [Alphaproteobacteria bacterium]
VALITGASSGIGKEMAYIHAEKGGDLVLVARRGEALLAIKEDIEAKHGVFVTVEQMDLTQKGMVAILQKKLNALHISVDFLVNNAGFGGVCSFHEGDMSTYSNMITLNIHVLTELTHYFLPRMLANGEGRILQVASVAGYVPGPYQAVYFATKAYVLSLSEALWKETEGTGVTVTALCPGAVHTEFAEVANATNAPGFAKARVSPRNVAKMGYEGMVKGERVVITEASNRMMAKIVSLLPRTKLLSMVATAMRPQ